MQVLCGYIVVLVDIQPSGIDQGFQFKWDVSPTSADKPGAFLACPSWHLLDFQAISQVESSLACLVLWEAGVPWTVVHPFWMSALMMCKGMDVIIAGATSGGCKIGSFNPYLGCHSQPIGFVFCLLSWPAICKLITWRRKWVLERRRSDTKFLFLWPWFSNAGSHCWV